MQEIIRQYQAMSDEELLLLYQDHQRLKVSDFTTLMLEMSNRRLNDRLFGPPVLPCAPQSTEPDPAVHLRPRILHYVFVHRLLRDKVFRDPPLFF